MRSIAPCATGCWTYPQLDRIGSTLVVTDESGLVDEAFAYSPYGLSTTDSGNNGFPFRFTGQRLDPETGLYYYKARFYSPELGRFLQTDPIGYADQMNLYAYVHNDPMNATDQTGEFAQVIWGAIIGAGVDLAVQAIQKNGDFTKIDPWQVARGAAIGAATGGVSALGRGLVKEAAKNGVANSAVTTTNAIREGAIMSAAAMGEAVNAGERGIGVLKSAAKDVATAKLGGVVLSEIEGGDQLVQEVGEQVSNAAGDFVRGAAEQSESRPLEVNISEGNGRCTANSPCND